MLNKHNVFTSIILRHNLKGIHLKVCVILSFVCFTFWFRLFRKTEHLRISENLTNRPSATAPASVTCFTPAAAAATFHRSLCSISDSVLFVLVHAPWTPYRAVDTQQEQRLTFSWSRACNYSIYRGLKIKHSSKSWHWSSVCLCVCCVLVSGVSVASEAGESAVVWSAGEFQSPLWSWAQSRSPAGEGRTHTHTHGYKLSVTFFKVELTCEDKYCLCAFRSNSAKWWHPRRSLCGCSLRGPTPPLCPKTPSASSSKTEMTSDRTCSSCRWVSASTVSDTHKWLKKGRSRSVSCRVPSDSADHGVHLGDWITGSLSVTVRLHLHWEQNRSVCQILKSDQTNITDTVWYIYFLPPSLLLYLRYDWDREGRHHHR